MRWQPRHVDNNNSNNNRETFACVCPGPIPRAATAAAPAACLPADVPPARCLLCFYLFIWLFVCLCLPFSLSACLTVWLFAYAFEQITTTIRIIMAATRMTLSWQIAKQLPQLDSISKFSKCQNICKLLWVLAHSHLRVPPNHMGAPLMETYVYYKFMPAL